MSFNDTTSDMIATIRNASAVKIATITVRPSGLNKAVLNVLQDEGYINGFEEVEVKKGVKRINVNLKYYEGQPVIKKIKRVSKPGLRKYSQIADLPKHYNGLGITILSTSKGVLADYKARTLNVGGEIICEVF
jgi:small subunit ribosomal protein S8